MKYLKYPDGRMFPVKDEDAPRHRARIIGENIKQNPTFTVDIVDGPDQAEKPAPGPEGDVPKKRGK